MKYLGSLEQKFDNTNFISPKRTPPKSPHRLGFIICKWQVQKDFSIISPSFHHHFKICLLWLLHKKECSFYSCLFCCTLMRWLFIISSAIWDTGSVASRAQSELNRSKCEWTRIWTIYNVHETTPNLDKQYWQVVTMEPDFILWLLHINLFEVPNFIITLWLELDMWVVEHNHVPWNQYSS
jgi:hypothetical protein